MPPRSTVHLKRRPPARATADPEADEERANERVRATVEQAHAPELRARHREHARLGVRATVRGAERVRGHRLLGRRHPRQQGGPAPPHDDGVFGFKCFLLHSGVDEFPHLEADEMEEALEEIMRPPSRRTGGAIPRPSASAPRVSPTERGKRVSPPTTSSRSPSPGRTGATPPTPGSACSTGRSSPAPTSQHDAQGSDRPQRSAESGVFMAPVVVGTLLEQSTLSRGAFQGDSGPVIRAAERWARDSRSRPHVGNSQSRAGWGRAPHAQRGRRMLRRSVRRPLASRLADGASGRHYLEWLSRPGLEGCRRHGPHGLSTFGRHAARHRGVPSCAAP